MIRKLLSLLLNPFFVSLILSLLIIYFLPDYFTKYKVNLIHEDYISPSRGPFTIYFTDMDNDGESEKIQSNANTLGNGSFMAFSHTDELINQWNFSYPFISGNSNVWFLDVNKNGYKEVYAITQKNDSLFLNVHEPSAENGLYVDKLFIDTTAIYEGKYQLYVDGGHSIESSKGRNEVLFTINAGYSGFPRNIYKFDYETNSISKSPHLTNNSTINQVIDLNGDGSSEIMIENHSSGNYIDSTYTTRSDSKTWFSVINRELNFIFEPVQVGPAFSGLELDVLEIADTKYIVLLINSRNIEQAPNKVVIYSTEGEMIREKALPAGTYFLFLNDNKEIILINRDIGTVQYYDLNLTPKSTLKFTTNFSRLERLDVDGDGVLEWFNLSKDGSTITISRKNTAHPISFQLPKLSGTTVSFGLKETKKESEFYVQNNEYYYVISYTKNPFYHLRLIIYLGIYLAVLGLVLLILKGQHMRQERKERIRSQIVNLQIKSFRSQMDPHFTFNVFNTMANKIMNENPENLDAFLEFSNLIRTTLLSSDSITRSLKDEISLLKSYLKLESMRFSDVVFYKINIAENVDMDLQIPKMLFQTYVENAIKHGIRPKTEHGMVEISVKKDVEQLLIEIKDNGIGRKKAKEIETPSTGFGLKIMNNYFDLFNQYNKLKIRQEIIDLYHKDGTSAGTKVVIGIPLKMSYKQFSKTNTHNS